MEVLFLNESDHGSHVLGADRFAATVQQTFEQADGVHARCLGLGRRGRLAGAVMERTHPLLRSRDLDFATARWHAVQSLRAARLARDELRAHPADVLFVNSHSIGLTMGRLARTTPLVLYVDVTVGDWARMPAWRRDHRHSEAMLRPSEALERRAFRSAAHVIAMSRWAADAVLRSAPAAHVSVAHPGIDLELFRPAPRREHALTRLLFVGGRFAEKGGDDLLAAVADDLGRRFEVDLVTPAPVAPREHVRVHALGPGDPRLVELLQQADALCLPSYGEGSPWVVLEALACGTPVVVGDVGAMPEMVEQGGAGIVVEPGDVSALRTALLALADEPARARALGARGRALCEQRYDLTVQGPLLVELLRETARPAGATAAPAAPAAPRR